MDSLPINTLSSEHTRATASVEFKPRFLAPQDCQAQG